MPVVKPVTKPELFTEATSGEAETQALDAAGAPEPTNWVVKPRQTPSVPVIVGSALTVTVAVALQPLLFV